MLSSSVRKKRAVGLVLLAVILALFLAFNRFPKLDTVRGDLDVVTAPEVECFQGFCIEAEPDSTLLRRWWDFSVTYLRLVAVGMTFAFLVAGLTEAFLFPRSSGRLYSWGGTFKGTLKGLGVGPIWNLCSACIVPVAIAFGRRGAGPAGTIAIIQGSSTLNLPALVMAAIVFTPLIGGGRLVLAVAGGLLIAPLVAMVVGQRKLVPGEPPAPVEPAELDMSPWGPVLAEGFRDWARSSLGYLVRLGPIMVLAAFVSGLAVQWISAETVESYLGNNISGIVIAATFGILINVPLLFEIPLVALLVLLGMGPAPAAALLFTAAAGGPITFWGLARLVPRRAILTFAVATWAVGIVGGIGVLGLVALTPARDTVLKESFVSAGSRQSTLTVPARGVLQSPESDLNGAVDPGLVSTVTPFTNIASQALDDGYWVWNDRPGVAVFDYDRDGDLDFYITSASGYSNLLYRNNGDATYVDVAGTAGVAAVESSSTGAVACDINNDGFQDLYVGARGVAGQRLDFRSALGDDDDARELREAIKDRLFVNNRDGTFTEITDSAFGDAVNLRSATSAACADVDNDGWLDIYVGNLIPPAFFSFDRASQPGHFNVLYRNNSDLTFQEIAESAGVRGPQIVFRDPEGRPLMFKNPDTGQEYEGYDPTARDAKGNPIGDPTGRTHAVLFFDYDDDGDPDLWVANDGDSLQVYRNDSSPGNVRFTPVAAAMGIDRVGNWMGFAVGDSDGDSDLDVFVTNVGYHNRLRPPQEEPGADCAYSDRFEWGTCLHFLLRNDGTREVPGLGTVGRFEDVAPSTEVGPSPFMPPESLDPMYIHSPWEVPTGLAAYDFGYGTTFFDYDNDGDQDLYWLGSEIGRGAGPGGHVYPSAGRMLRGDGRGSFEDITVRSHLLDILNVDYAYFEPEGPGTSTWQQRLRAQNLRVDFHENGKGLAHGDLNGDGYVDLIGTNSSGPVNGDDYASAQVRGPVFVWLNGGGENHWITLRLRGRMAVDGTGSNADGIGARVYVKAIPEGQAEPLTQVQEVLGGSSYLSMDSTNLEFGVGTAMLVDRIVVFWPSGRRQVLSDISVDQTIVITEPED